MWTLIRVFPIIIGNKLKDNQNYLNFNYLIEISRLLNGSKIDENTLSLLEKNIENYLNEFKRLYEGNITEKQHFLIHYTWAII